MGRKRAAASSAAETPVKKQRVWKSLFNSDYARAALLANFQPFDRTLTLKALADFLKTRAPLLKYQRKSKGGGCQSIVHFLSNGDPKQAALVRTASNHSDLLEILAPGTTTRFTHWDSVWIAHVAQEMATLVYSVFFIDGNELITAGAFKKRAEALGATEALFRKHFPTRNSKTATQTNYILPVTAEYLQATFRALGQQGTDELRARYQPLLAELKSKAKDQRIHGDAEDATNAIIDEIFKVAPPKAAVAAPAAKVHQVVGPAAEVHQENGLDAEVLGGNGLAAEVLRKNRLAAEVLHKNGLAVEVLQKNSPAAEVHQQNGLAVEVLQQSGPFAEVHQENGLAAAEVHQENGLAAQAHQENGLPAEVKQQNGPAAEVGEGNSRAEDRVKLGDNQAGTAQPSYRDADAGVCEEDIVQSPSQIFSLDIEELLDFWFPMTKTS